MITKSSQRRGLARPAAAPRTRRPLVLLLVFALALAASAPADGDTASKILVTCGHSQIPSGYSQQDYKRALKKLSPFLVEYSNCEELIHRAQLAAAGGPSRGSGGGVGGSGIGASGSTGAPVAPPTPTEQRSLEHAHSNGAGPVEVGGQVIHPGVVHTDVASAFSSLPTPLLVILIFLITCALLALGLALRRYVGARRLEH